MYESEMKFSTQSEVFHLNWYAKANMVTKLRGYENNITQFRQTTNPVI